MIAAFYAWCGIIGVFGGIFALAGVGIALELSRESVWDKTKRIFLYLVTSLLFALLAGYGASNL